MGTSGPSPTSSPGPVRPPSPFAREASRAKILPEPSVIDTAAVQDRLSKSVALPRIQHHTLGPGPEQLHLTGLLPQLMSESAIIESGRTILNAKASTPAAQTVFAPDVTAARNAKSLQAINSITQMVDYLVPLTKAPNPEATQKAAKKCLEDLAKLVDKSFSPVGEVAAEAGGTTPVGGSPGSPLTPPRGWGEGATTLQNIKDRLAALRTIAENGTWSGTNQLHREMSGVAAACTVGQLIEDYVCNPGYSAFADRFKDILRSNGYRHVDDAVAARPNLRGSPLLAEIPLDIRVKDIEKGEKTLQESLQTTQGLSPEKSAAVAKALTATLKQRVETQYRTLEQTAASESPKAYGARGRRPAPPARGERAHPEVAGPHRLTGQARETVSLLEHGSFRLLSSELYSLSQAERDACKHGPAPATVLVLGRLDPLSINPEEEGLDNQQVVEQLKDSLKPLVASKTITQAEANQIIETRHDTIGAIQITINKKGNTQLPLQDASHFPTMARLIQRRELATVCGPSGTTVDILGAVIAEKGRDAVAQMLDPLYKLAIPEGVLTAPEDAKITPGEWQKLFGSVSYFMQAGNYHSAAEVLAGLWIGAANLHTPPLSDMETMAGFNRLLQIFARNPAAVMGTKLTSFDTAAIKELFTAVFQQRLAG